ncbi:unnamed protein product [Oreochromis niloticus]|nr:unnamed protein product [Mustela putorius furo]
MTTCRGGIYQQNFKMSKKYKLTSESKPSIQGVGGGIALEDLHEHEQQSLVKSGTPINNKDPSPNPGSSSASSVGDGVTIQNEGQQQEEPGSPENNMELHEIIKHVMQNKYPNFLNEINVNNYNEIKEKINSFIEEISNLINPDKLKYSDKSNIFKRVMDDWKKLQEAENPICVKRIPKLKTSIIILLVRNLIWPQGAINSKIPICLDKFRNPLFNHYLNTGEKNKINQYGFYLILMKDGTLMISEKIPQDSKNQTHSEEFIIKELDEFLSENGNEVKKFFIYSYNSPCLKRTDNKTPCMFQLLRKACEWYEKYQIFTDVAFTHSYGICGPNYFNYLTFDEISCPNSGFNSYIEKCKNTKSELENQNKSKLIKSKLSKALDKEKIDIKTLKNDDIQTACNFLKKAESSFDLLKDFLVSGRETHVSFKSPPEVQAEIYKILKENNTFMRSMKKCIRADLNNAIPFVFRKKLESILGSRGFFRLHHIPHSFPC